MKQFPYKKTEQLLNTLNPSTINEEDYRQLLQTFINEHRQEKKVPAMTSIATSTENLSMDLTEYILDYLLEGDEISHLTWYYTLEHQISYFSCHHALDYADLHFVTLTDIVLYPVEYLDRQLLLMQEAPKEPMARVTL